MDRENLKPILVGIRLRVSHPLDEHVTVTAFRMWEEVPLFSGYKSFSAHGLCMLA